MLDSIQVVNLCSFAVVEIINQLAIHFVFFHFDVLNQVIKYPHCNLTCELVFKNTSLSRMPC